MCPKVHHAILVENTSDLYPTWKVAKFLGTSPRQIVRMIHRQELQAIHILTRYYIRGHEVHRYLSTFPIVGRKG